MNTTTTISRAPFPPAALMEAAYREPCRILEAHVTRVARGGTESVICTEYCDGVCRLRQAALELALQGLPDVPSEGLPPARNRCIMLTS